MVKMSFSPSVQKKKWTKSGQNPVIYQGFFDFPKNQKIWLFHGKNRFLVRVLIFVTLGGAHQVIETVNDNMNQTRAKRSLKSDRWCRRTSQVSWGGSSNCSANTCCSRKSLCIILYNYRNLCVFYSYKISQALRHYRNENVVVTKRIVTEATSLLNKQSE